MASGYGLWCYDAPIPRAGAFLTAVFLADFFAAVFFGALFAAADLVAAFLGDDERELEARLLFVGPASRRTASNSKARSGSISSMRSPRPIDAFVSPSVT